MSWRQYGVHDKELTCISGQDMKIGYGHKPLGFPLLSFKIFSSSLGDERYEPTSV